MNEAMMGTMFMRATVVLFAALCFVAYFVWQKIKYQKKVVGKVFCEFITKEGNGYARLLPLGPGGIVEIKPTKKRKGMLFALEELGTYLIDYPPGKWAFLQSKVKKALLDEDSMEPLSKRCGVVTLSPIRLANLVNERFSSLGVAYSLEESGQKGIGKPKQGPNMIYAILVILGLAIVGIAYFMVTKWDAISAALGVK